VIRGISKCREARYGGFWKNIISVHRHKDLPLGQSDMSSPRLNTRRFSPDEGEGAAFAKYSLAKKGTDGSAEGRGCWIWRRPAGKQRWGTALASSRQPCESFKSPWGRGMVQRRTEVGRGRRSGTVWRRRSLGSSAAGKARYMGLLEKSPVPTIF
jgi:hypothetical protein